LICTKDIRVESVDSTMLNGRFFYLRFCTMFTAQGNPWDRLLFSTSTENLGNVRMGISVCFWDIICEIYKKNYNPRKIAENLIHLNEKAYLIASSLLLNIFNIRTMLAQYCVCNMCITSHILLHWLVALLYMRRKKRVKNLH